ncbi:MAG: hypothetical protein CBC35_05650 [Planctomycetes bacterium TMED75]|nr:hypothetical protein [Planctomycetaceae bacterium]OUU93415.1 MAG: hypothetical protein CBC35_05650 [Planctomycetes bacterium TMED75]
MDVFFENIVLMLLLMLLLVAASAFLFILIIRRACQPRISPLRPPKPPAPPSGGDSNRVDPWVESGRRFTMGSEPSSDSGSDEGPALGERFE